MLKNKEEDKIYILQSNHFVEEYLKQLPIHPELKGNPRFQAIIWHISVMLKREGIPFHDEQAKMWIEHQIQIGKNGEVGYMLNAKDRYYPDDYLQTIQFVQYAYNGEQVQRHVKEVNNQETTMEILSFYNEDGIEEKQLVNDEMYGNRHLFERVRKIPELRHVQEHFEHYQQVNQEYGRTSAFEKGMAKLFMVRSHQR